MKCIAAVTTESGTAWCLGGVVGFQGAKGVFV